MPHASPIPIRELTERSPQPVAFRDFVEGMVRFNNYLNSDKGEELQAASKAFASAVDADPSFLLARFHQAVAYAHLRCEDEAIRIFEELVEQKPLLLPEIYHNLAQACLHKYQYDRVLDAERAFEKAEALFAANPKKRHFRYLVQAAKLLLYAVLGGRRLQHPNDFDERKKKYLRVGAAKGEALLLEYSKRLSPSRTQLDNDVMSEAHNGLGAIYMRMGQYAELLDRNQSETWKSSEEHYRACLDIRPTSTPTLHNLGTLHRLQGARALQLGDIKEMREQFAEARRYYVRSLTINPFDQFPHYGAGVCSVYLEEWTSAAQYVKSGESEHGQIRPEHWEKLKEAIARRDPTLLPPEEA